MLRHLNPFLALLTRSRPLPRTAAPLRPLLPELSTANFSSSQRSCRIQYPSRPKPPPESEIQESYLKGSGPGGQKINKTNSAVQLTHTPTGIVVKCQATRSRTQNRKIARDLLATKLDNLRYETSKNKAATIEEESTELNEDAEIDEDTAEDQEGEAPSTQPIKGKADEPVEMSRSAFIANVKRKKKASAAKKSKRKHQKAVAETGGEGEAASQDEKTM